MRQVSQPEGKFVSDALKLPLGGPGGELTQGSGEKAKRIGTHSCVSHLHCHYFVVNVAFEPSVSSQFEEGSA